MKITFFYPNENVASGRYRGAIPYRWLKDHGFEDGSDVLIIGKHLWPYDPTREYKSYIFDVCDDHFHTEHQEHYRKHCDRANTVTCNSEVMRDIIKRETGRDAIVIPDPVDLPRQEPHFEERMLWFGNKWNFKPVRRVLPSLPQIDFRVMSEPFSDLVIPWTRGGLISELEHAGVVILPVDASKPAKSANRMIEAINAGCFVSAEPLPCHEEFEDFVWIGDIAKGVEWYLNNPDKALEKVAAGQDYIDKHYLITKIGPMWEKAIRGTY